MKLDLESYQKLMNCDTVFVKVNEIDTLIPVNLLSEILHNDNYYQYLNDCINNHQNLEIALLSNQEIIAKAIFSTVSIVQGLKKWTANPNVTLENKIKLKINYLTKKVNFEEFLKKNHDNKFELMIDNKSLQSTYGEILKILFEPSLYFNFINAKYKFLNLEAEEYIYYLKELFQKENILGSYIMDEIVVRNYSYLINNYDIESINKFIKTEYETLKNVNLNSELEERIISLISPKKTKVEKVIYLYYNLIQILTYDEEYESLVDIVKTHKDYSRIELITSHYNKVVNYEFVAIFCKFLEKLKINYEFNDTTIKFRIGKYILKANSISSAFDKEKNIINKILGGINVLNHDKRTVAEFNNILASIHKEIYDQKLNTAILKMSYKESLEQYRKISSKNKMSFKSKLDLLISLIEHTENIGRIDIGYIFQLKTILFSDSELNSNINFITISENNKKISNPIVIITYNEVNVHLYNSNKYIYYNPPQALKTYNLLEIRKEFFNGRFSYIKGTKEDIIGVEKSGAC